MNAYAPQNSKTFFLCHLNSVLDSGACASTSQYNTCFYAVVLYAAPFYQVKLCNSNQERKGKKEDSRFLPNQTSRTQIHEIPLSLDI